MILKKLKNPTSSVQGRMGKGGKEKKKKKTSRQDKSLEMQGNAAVVSRRNLWEQRAINPGFIAPSAH